MDSIKYKNELLQQIAAGVAKLRNVRIECLSVTLKTDTDAYDFGFAQVLDVLANDLTWDERGRWADARIAEVTTI